MKTDTCDDFQPELYAFFQPIVAVTASGESGGGNSNVTAVLKTRTRRAGSETLLQRFQ